MKCSEKKKIIFFLRNVQRNSEKIFKTKEDPEDFFLFSKINMVLKDTYTNTPRNKCGWRYGQIDKERQRNTGEPRTWWGIGGHEGEDQQDTGQDPARPAIP